MEPHAPNKTGKAPPSRRPDWLTPEVVGQLLRIIQTLATVVIGIILACVFAVLIVAIVVVALLGERAQALQVLNLAISLASWAFGTVLGYFFGRRR